MKTRDEIEELKENWKADACWDIENTEGYADAYEELLNYRLEMEQQWEEDLLNQSFEDATNLFLKFERTAFPTEEDENEFFSKNLALLIYLAQLDNRVLRLENKTRYMPSGV
jgi:hypothetical protein